MSDYQGWSNRETWAVNLYLRNSALATRTVRGLATLDVDTFEDALVEYVSGLLPDPGGLAGDLLDSAISNVSFREIANFWLNEERI